MPGNGVQAGGPGSDAVRVLVVDDQEAFRGALRQLLHAAGGFALAGEATSGEDALEMVEELSPQLVIMDRHMPGMDGIEATRELTRRRPAVPVVLVSLEPLVDHVAEAAGAAAVVRKQDLTPNLLRELWSSIRG